MKKLGKFINKLLIRLKEARKKWGKLGDLILFPIMGLLALIWVIIRVGPKPSRLRYPCMKVAVPTATSFLAYIAAIFTSLFSFRKARQKFKKARYIPGILLILVSFGAGIFLVLHTDQYAFAQIPVYETRELESNQPMGEAKGFFPGRVVWVHDPDATDENCDPGDYGDGWFLTEHNDTLVIDAMLDTAVKAITGKNTITAAWDTIFKYHNFNRGKGQKVGYQQGEKILIKINRTSAWGMGSYGNINNDFTPVNNSYYGMSETSPHLILSLLQHLVNYVGVAQEYIYVGDPMKHVYSHDYDLWHSRFPDVNYLDHDTEDPGRYVVSVGDSIIYYSDSGAVLREGPDWNDASSGDPVYQDYFYKIFEDCEYLINVPTLKGHRRAGVTMFAKNHFGSHTRSSAQHLHMGLVAPDNLGERPENERFGYGLYRVAVDFMGYSLLRKKNLIFLMDALWSAGHENIQPSKWQIEPFNNDWSSSIFISLDQVAIESVGFDFLRAEYTSDKHPDLTYVQMEGTDDYLEQAADSANWPDGIDYDPEGDGTPMPWSLGVHEHWDNATNKNYSRNINPDDSVGIELVKVFPDESGIHEGIGRRTLAVGPALYQNSPNPFNSSTTIRYKVSVVSTVELSVYNITGQKVATLVNSMEKLPGSYRIGWNGTYDNGGKVPSGVYFCKLRAIAGGKRFEETEKMLIVR